MICICISKIVCVYIYTRINSHICISFWIYPSISIQPPTPATLAARVSSSCAPSAPQIRSAMVVT